MKREKSDFSAVRRNFLKSALAVGAGAIALSGCDKKDETIEKTSSCKDDDFDIIPKQTGLYEFSCPLPFDFKVIDEIAKLNEGLKKSKVTSFYNNAPNQNFNNWVSISRARNDKFKSYEEFGKFVKYAQDRGISTTYLMNSPKPFSEKDFKTFEKEFYYLLDYLLKINCYDIKIANPQVAYAIREKYGEQFRFHASTATEYNQVSQYDYLFREFPNFTLIDITNGENQNFRLLKELRNKFPKMKLELMVNETCIKSCPYRVCCISENSFKADCAKLRKDMGWLHYTLKCGLIYPWNLEYYSALGINNFKLIASNGEKKNGRDNYHDITALKGYLDCVEEGIDGKSSNFFFETIFDKLGVPQYVNHKSSMKLTELKELLPDIRYFIKNGHKCSIKCNNGCNYCGDCAKKIEEKLVYRSNNKENSKKQ